MPKYDVTVTTIVTVEAENPNHALSKVKADLLEPARGFRKAACQLGWGCTGFDASDVDPA